MTFRVPDHVWYMPEHVHAIWGTCPYVYMLQSQARALARAEARRGNNDKKERSRSGPRANESASCEPFRANTSANIGAAGPRGIGPPAVDGLMQHVSLCGTRLTRARTRARARAETHRVVVDDLF